MKDLPARHAQQLFALSADLLVVVDADQRIVAVNPSWERVLGYQREDLVGTPLRDLRHPDDWERSEAAVKDIIAGQPMPGFENRFRHADGHYVWLRWSAAADRDGGYIYASARDITEERQAIEDARAATRRLEEAQRVA
ncbi:MAG TPA: PAS domain S-box protein, partial [Baekduia sp.]|nr:PAS domain S-box protein [Baekduia sp.]